MANEGKLQQTKKLFHSISVVSEHLKKKNSHPFQSRVPGWEGLDDLIEPLEPPS